MASFAPMGNDNLGNGKKGNRRQRNQRAATKTTIKTGWAIEAEKETEWDAVTVEPVKPVTMWVDVEEENTFINEDYIHALSVEDQKLHQWKKTQRGGPVKIVPDFWDISSKFKTVLSRPQNKMSNVVPIATEEPAPSHSSEPIGDTGRRGTLNLECMKEKRFLKAFEYDVEERAKESSSSVSKTRIGQEFLNIRQPKCNFTISLSDGLQPSIFQSSENGFNRIICVTRLDISEVRKGLQNRFESFKGAQEMKPMDVAKFTKTESGGDSKKTALLKASNIFEVFFGESEEGQKFCEEYGPNKQLFSMVARFPEELEQGKESTSYSIKLHYLPFVSNQKAKIWVKNPEEVNRALAVLKKNLVQLTSFGEYEIVDKLRDGGSRLIAASWTKCSLDVANDRVVLEKILQRIFGENGIELDKVTMDCRNINFKNHIAPKIQKVVNEHVNKIKIDCDKSWTIEHLDSSATSSSRREALIVFDEPRLGEFVARSVEANMNRDFSGFSARPIFCVRIEVPKPIRTVCYPFLESLHSKIGDCSDLENWVRLRELQDEESLIIEGWPAERVHQIAEKVKIILKPKKINCNDDGTDQSPAKLLYGNGLAFVNKMQAESTGAVLISVNRLNEKIHIWGDKDRAAVVIDSFKKYLKGPKEYLIDTVIHIRSPRFLPVFKEVLSFTGEQDVSNAVGGASVKFMKPDRVVFKGSLKQYEALQELLDEDHAKMIAKASKSGLLKNINTSSLSSKACPVCLMPPRGGYSLDLCGHTYCVQCLTQMIRVAMHAKMVPIKCCEQGCDNLVALSDIKGLLFDATTKDYESVFRHRLEPLWKATYEKAVMNSKDLILCPKADCRGVINKTEKSSNGTVECTQCRGRLCSDCYSHPHPQWSCAEDKKYRENSDSSLAQYLKSGVEARNCPNEKCKAVIEKDLGCNHMHCRPCNTHFCWICPSFITKTRGEMYAHLYDVHGSTGGEWAFLDEQ